MLRELTTNQKGAIAESAIAEAACALGMEVYGPLFGERRYDMISLRVSPARNNQRLRVPNASDFEFGARLERLIPGP